MQELIAAAQLKLNGTKFEKRGIFRVDTTITRPSVLIVTFKDGVQTNIDRY